MLGGADDLRDAFKESLNSAIAHGLRPSRWIGLGDQTCTAIEAIAQDHPDATVALIADAYDAFDREHSAHAGTEPPERLVARRGPFVKSRGSVPVPSAADRAPDLPEDQQHDADDEQDPPDRRDDAGYGQ
jgi:hypothetical protein